MGEDANHVNIAAEAEAWMHNSSHTMSTPFLGRLYQVTSVSQGTGSNQQENEAVQPMEKDFNEAIYKAHLVNLESHNLTLKSLHEEAKDTNGGSLDILRGIEALQNQAYALLAEARLILGKQSLSAEMARKTAPKTVPKAVPRNQDVPMADHSPPIDGVPLYQKPYVEDIRDEHDQAKDRAQNPEYLPFTEPSKSGTVPSTPSRSKRQVLDPEPTVSKPKRKYAHDSPTNGLPPQSMKKTKRHLSPDGDQEPEFIPTIQLEDITAEVDARIRAKDEMKARERARLQDTNPKRKSQPLEMTWIEDGLEMNDPSTERRKKIRTG